MAKSLYDLGTEYANIESLIDDEESNLQEALDEIGDAIDIKAENIGVIIKMQEAQKKILKDERDRLSKREKVIDNAISGMKRYLEENLTLVGKTKIKGVLASVTIQKTPPSVQITDDTAIPSEFWTVNQKRDFSDLTPEEQEEYADKKALSKKEILDLSKDGYDVPGTEIVQGTAVVIR